MRKSVRVLWRRLGLSLAEAMHDRVDFAIESLAQLTVIAINVIFFSIVYSHVQTLNGWSYYETLLVLGLYQVSDGFYQLLLRPNVRRIPKLVRYGRLDAALTQPLDPQINLIRRYAISQLAVIGTSIGLLLYAAYQLDIAPLELLAVASVSLTVAFLFQWAVVFAVNTLGFWLIRNDNLIHAATALLELAKIPTSAYGNAIHLGFTFLVPLAIVATIPAELLLGRGAWQVAVIASAVVLLLFIASRRFFFWALRSYNSASG